MARARFLTAGLDIGGTKMALQLADVNGRIAATATAATPTASPEQFWRGVFTLINDALAAHDLSPAALAGIGVGIPGRVDVARGDVYTAVNLNLTHYPLGEALAAEFGVPVVVENDVRAAAVGAYDWLSRETAVRHLAYLNLGTGVSAGLILNGQLHRGARGMAGEIGHVVVEPDGQRCNCGQRGCLETIISGPALLRQTAALFPESEDATAVSLYTAAAAGHTAAAALVDRIAHAVTFAIQWLVMACDVTHIVLGGGVTRLGPPFIRPVQDELNRLRAASPLMRTMITADMVQQLPADYNAGAWGAIKLVQQRLAEANEITQVKEKRNEKAV